MCKGIEKIDRKKQRSRSLLPALKHNECRDPLFKSLIDLTQNILLTSKQPQGNSPVISRLNFQVLYVPLELSERELGDLGRGTDLEALALSRFHLSTGYRRYPQFGSPEPSSQPSPSRLKER